MLESRGLIIDDREKAIRTLSFINYYKIKECSFIYFNTSTQKYSSNTTFNDILQRFYENKNLRIDLLRLTEKVELSLKTKVSYILGRKYGATGYLNFKNWANKNEYDKHYIECKENDFKNRIVKNFNKSKNQLIKTFKNYNDVPIWLIVDILTFGEILDIFKLMLESEQNEISKDFSLKTKEFIS
ncbi:Abi family protein [Oceanivirga miroungae]|uniref:Abi family protein n=1 Tax=Oceanivirga miroungae TaxID=1130046 RepID=A0A6I8MF04_9FUSO|nr:Abi family protein [Oceanivirga miroungae]VWL85841.1 Abi family protein [Oceanivirga miroungae]